MIFMNFKVLSLRAMLQFQYKTQEGIDRQAGVWEVHMIHDEQNFNVI